MTTETQIATVNIKDAFSLIESNRDKIAAILPTGVTVMQFMANLNAVVQQTPDLASCTAPSLLGAMLHVARLGLKPGMLNQAWLLPYFNSRKNCREAQVIIGFEGLRDLAMRTGNVDNIQSHLVYEKDFFEVSLGDDSKITHKPLFFSERGSIIGVYAICFYKSGTCQFEIMSKEEIDVLKATSKSQNIWTKYYGEMARKSVIRKLCKHLPKSTDQLSTALELENGADTEEGQATEQILSNAGIEYEKPRTVAQETEYEIMKAKVVAQLEEMTDEEIQATFARPLAAVIERMTSIEMVKKAMIMLRAHESEKNDNLKT